MCEPEFAQPLFNNSIKYLHAIAGNVPGSPILKSYYSAKFRILEERGNVYLPAVKNKAKSRCPRCCLVLSEGPASCRVKAEEKLSVFARKVLKKVEQGKSLTEFQRKYAKKLKPKNTNHLVMTCKFCNNEIVHPMSKPPKLVVHVADESLDGPSKVKKKKKKKDKLCGLKISAVSEANSDYVSLDTQSQKPKKLVKMKANSEQVKGEKNNAAVKVAPKKDLVVKISAKKKAHLQRKTTKKLTKLLNTVTEPKKGAGLAQFLKNF